jgi:RNA polymerase sigma factor (sigma-70 family)
MMPVGTARTVRAIGTERQREMALRLARGIWKRVPPHVPLEDLEQVALTELWQALERKGAEASVAYLVICIQGRVKDELRRHDWLPRYSRQSGLNLHVIHLADIDNGFEAGLPSPAPSPEDAIDARQMGAEIWKAPLPPRERHILRSHYQRGRRFSDIAAELGISEPRVSQVHHRAIAIVKAWLTGEFDADTPADDRTHVPVRLRKAIMEKHAAHPHAEKSDPAPGGAPSEPPPTDTFLGRVRRGRLGCAPDPEPHRPVPGGAGAPGAGAPALDRGAGPELRDLAPAEAAPPGEVVEEPAELAAVPSVLPEGGLDLRAELARYRDWIVEQALLRTGGHQRKTADLLGLKESVFSRLVTRGRGLITPHVRNNKPASAPAPSPAMKPQRRRAEHGDSLNEVMSRLPRAQIAKWHEEGKTTGYMATQLKRQISAGYSLLELAVRRTVASLARHDQQSGGV